MSNPPIEALPTTAVPMPLPAEATVWDRISTWVSEHKAVVYTVAGVAVVVTGAGVVYYLNNGPVCSSPLPTKTLRFDAMARVEVLFIVPRIVADGLVIEHITKRRRGRDAETEQEGAEKTQGSRAQGRRGSGEGDCAN